MGADFGNAVIKMVGSLLLILGLIICLFYWFRKIRFGSFSSQAAPRMRLIGTLNLAPRRAVALIEICDQWFLVGIGTENVSLISRIDSVPEGGGVQGTVQDQEKGFQSVLRNTVLFQPWKKIMVRGQDADS